MTDLVSRWINVLMLSASLLVVGGVLLPAFPWSTLVFVSVSAAVALWLKARTSTRTTSQVIWDVRAEPVPVTVPVQKTGR